MWTFSDAEKYLADTAPRGKSVYGLGRIFHLLELLKNPEKWFETITVVGTNGKGSTIAFLDALFLAHGVSVVCHIKPHLESVTERIRINGRDSTEEEFAEALLEVKKAVDSGWSREDRPTYFELLFSAALVKARSEGVQIALLETGLGGRLDAVNAVDSEMVVLTSVAKDHTELLGDTLELITREKLAVVRPGTTLICRENPPEVMDTVRSYAEENDVNVINSKNAGRLDDFKLGLAGSFQVSNATLALTSFEFYCTKLKPGILPDGLMEKGIRQGLADARIPGRWEIIFDPDGGLSCILDGAHNPDGLIRIFSEIRDFDAEYRTIVFGMKASKEVSEILPSMMESADRLIFVPVPDCEYHLPSELARLAQTIKNNAARFSQIQIDSVDSIVEGLDAATDGTPRGGIILVTGSLYLVGAVRGILRAENLIPEAVSRV